jgi:prepilin-type N-terminal cleavage/methylation domain-containing protein
MQTHRRGAFTLVELLVVIAIIALLAGLLLSAIGHGRTQVLKSSAKGRMATLMMAMLEVYSNRNDVFMDLFPESTNWDQWLGPTGGEAHADIKALVYPYNDDPDPDEVERLHGQGIIEGGDSFADPWGTPYSVYLDTTEGTMTMRSWGPNRTNDSKNGSEDNEPEEINENEGPEGDDFEVTKYF